MPTALTPLQRRSLSARWHGRASNATTPSGSIGDVLTLNSDLVPEWTAPGGVDADLIYDVDFTGLANNTLTNGAESIDGLSWTAANMASLGTAAVQASTGIRFAAGTSLGAATTMTSASQAAPYISIPLSSITGYDPRRDVIVEVYLANLVTEASGEGFFVGLYGPASSPSSTSAARMRWAGLYNNAGSRALRTMTQATAVNTTDTRTTHNVVGFRLSATGIGLAWSSVYSSGFPTPIIGMPFATLAGSSDPMAGASCSLIMGLSVANDASPTTAVTVARMVVTQP